MDRVISESESYNKGSFSYNSFVKFHGKKMGAIFMVIFL